MSMRSATYMEAEHHAEHWCQYIVIYDYDTFYLRQVNMKLVKSSVDFQSRQ